MIRDLTVVEDPVRTAWNTPTDPDNGAWTFGRFMTDLAGATDPATFTETMFLQFGADQIINGDRIPARPQVFAQVLDPWPRLADGALDLQRAPMRLLAFNVRLDLTQPEFRAIFGVVTPDGAPKPFTVILEYKALGSKAQIASDFHTLAALDLGSAEYNARLAQLVTQYTVELNQLRTNEIALAAPWELREFRLDGAGALAMVDVKQTPAFALQGSPRLATWVNDNEAALLDGSAVVPLELDGVPFRAGAAPTPVGTFWNAPGITNPDARHALSLNTCNGCHSRETQTAFTHVSPRAAGQVAVLSGFLTGIDVTDPVVPETTRTFGELAARQAITQALLCDAPPPPAAAARANRVD